MADVQDPAILEAYNDVRDDNTATNWLVLQYESDKSDKLTLKSKGTGGLNEFVDNLQKDQAAFELNKTIRGVVDARLRIEQYKTAVDHSEESLRITNNRYERGLVSTTDVLQSQSQLAAQQLSLEQAILENNVLQAYLQFLTVSER